MKQDPVLEQYASDLFSKESDRIRKEHLIASGKITSSWIDRGHGACSGHMQELVKDALTEAYDLAMARISSQITAFEKSGIPVDESILDETENHAVALCRELQGKATTKVLLMLDRYGMASQKRQFEGSIAEHFARLALEVRRDSRIQRMELGFRKDPEPRIAQETAAPGNDENGETEQLPVLSEQEQKFRDIFLARSPEDGLLGPRACDEYQRETGAGIDESDFRTRIVPRLKKWGLKNVRKRGYYFPADAAARRAALG